MSDIFWALIIGAILIIPAFLTGRIQRWIEQKRAQEMMRLSQSGRVYPMPAGLRGLIIWFWLALAATAVIPIKVRLSGQPVDEFWLIYPLAVFSLLPFSYWFIRLSSGFIVLTHNEIFEHRWGRRQTLALADITTVDEHDYSLPPNLVLRGQNGRLHISQWIDNFAELYRELFNRSSHFRRAINAELKSDSPISLRVRPAVLWLNGLPLVAIVTGLLILAFLPVVRGTAGQAQAISVLLVGLAAGTCVFFALLFDRGELKRRQPIELNIDHRQIRYRLPRGKWRTLAVKEVRNVALKVTMPHSPSSAPALSASRVVITFRSGKTLEIDGRRARQFGSSPQRIHLQLLSVWPQMT